MSLAASFRNLETRSSFYDGEPMPCINGQLLVQGSLGTIIIGTIIIYFKLFRIFLNLQKELNSVMEW